VPLTVAGDGPELPRLRRYAGPNVRFVVDPSRDDLRELYRHARALVNTGVEDVGMTMVEAQACGAPVLAFARGGATEAVVDGVTGTLYTDPEPATLATVLRSFDPERFEPEAVLAQARRFDAVRFDEEITRIVSEVLRG
jgi:glycosyltransferase involved in cell wall biosynthesis